MNRVRDNKHVFPLARSKRLLDAIDELSHLLLDDNSHNIRHENLLKKLKHKVSRHPQYSSHEYVNVKWTNNTERQYAMKRVGATTIDKS